MEHDPARRAAARKTAVRFALVYLVTAIVLLACLPERAPAAEAAPSVTSSRICAAAQVYRLATADDWGQRAVIAATALNSYRAAGHVPDCGRVVVAIFRDGLNPLRWQSALDAVDAVASGSYSVPRACTRANRVVPPVDAVGPGSQCVMGGLAFVEVQP